MRPWLRKWSVAGYYGTDLLPVEEKIGGLGIAELRRLKQMEDETCGLKRPIADLSLA